jgi:hypothetical protein
MLPTIAANIRPNSPRNWVHSTQANVNLVWHHVLPFHELRGLWNTLVTQCHGTRLAEARTALHQYLRLCDRNLAGVDAWIDRIRAERLAVADCDMLATTAVWPAWNVVEGPDTRFRSDDPGDDFIDRYTHGITRQEYGRMIWVEELHRRLASTPLSGNITPAVLRMLADHLSTARPHLACEGPIPFRQSMWTYDALTRKWSKIRGGEQFILA